MSDMLNVKGLSISFGGLKAVNNFAINIEKGQLYGLIGPNGAGKTTIFNLLTGVYKPDTGTLEIARALATEPKLLLLDEPAAGMNPNETAELMETIRFVRDHFGMTILLIEHDMKLVSGICERLTVLNFGQVLCTGPTQEVLSNPEVIKAYLGE